MATIGALGDIVFSVSSEQVKTFDGLQWNGSAQYATHSRHLKDALLEFVGMDADKISFSMYFSVFLGLSPLDEIEKLLTAKREGRAMRFIIGGKPYGKHRWVITDTSKTLERFDSKGNLLIARANVSLSAYAGR
jgi:phage protein U